MSQKVIAYGNGGETQDKHRRNVLHVECWPIWCRIGTYTKSIDSVYMEGAENAQLVNRVCAHCGKKFSQAV